MAEAKQDVTIAAGTPLGGGGGGVNPNALKLLASLSSGNAEKTKTSAGGLVSTGCSEVVRRCCCLHTVFSVLFHRPHIPPRSPLPSSLSPQVSSVSLDNKTTVAMSSEDSSPTSTTGSARNTTSSKTMKRKLGEHNKTTFSTTTTSGSNKKSKKLKKKKKKSTSSSSSSSSEQRDAEKNRFVSNTEAKNDQSSSSNLMSRLFQQQQGGMNSHLVGASGAGSIFNTSTAAMSAAGLAATNNNNGILDISAAAPAAAGGNNGLFDAYLRERLAAIRGGSVSGNATASASLAGIGGGAAGGMSGLGMSAPSSSPTLASIMAARRSNQLNLMLQMEEYERSLYGLGGGLSGTGTGGLGGAGGASSLLYGRLGLDSGLGLGGHSPYAALAGGGLGRNFQGLTTGSHLADMANFQSLRSSALMSGMSAAEQLEVLRATGSVPEQATSISGTDKLSALAMTAVATSGAPAANVPGGKSSVAAKRNLGPDRGKSKQNRRTNDEKNSSNIDSDQTDDDPYSQRFRGYQCEQWTGKFNDLVKFKATHGHW